MLAVFTFSMNPLTSSSLSGALNPPKTASSPFTPLHLHGWLSIMKLTPIPLLGLPLSKRSLVQCKTLTATNNSTDLLTDSGITLFSLFREIGIDDKGTEIMLDNHPALKFTPFQSIRTRIQCLQALGINGLSLSRLIHKRPDFFIDKEIDSFICFLFDDLIKGKIEGAQLERLFIGTDPKFFLGFEGKVRLLLHLGVPREKLDHVLNNVNLTKALCLKSSEEIERTITFLNRFGGVHLILRRPAILNYDLDTQLIPRIGFLLEVSGGDENATATVLRKLPFVLAYSVEHLKDHVEFLRSFAGLSDQEIFRIILVYPNLFSASRKRKLHPRIDFLKQCGLSSNDIFRFLIKAPLFLSLSFEGNLAYKLVFLIKIGYENSTKELAMAMGAVTRTSCKNMQEVISLFLNYGLTCEDILAMAKKHPQVLQYNHGSLEEKMDYLIEEMGREVGELLAFPAFLGYKFDGRIKYRYEAKGKILGEGMSINKLLSVSTARFAMKKKSKRHPVNVLENLSEGEA